MSKLSDSLSIETEGIVTKVHGYNSYLVEIGKEGEERHEIPCYLNGRMRRYRISILPGDPVTVEVPAPYDRGRIIYRGEKLDRVEKSDKRPKGRGGRRKS